MTTSKYFTVMCLTVFFFLGLFLRLYNLNSVPAGFHVDEAKIGWNAYSLLKTGQDDWGHAFPLHYNTFGDFRPTGYMYAVVPSIVIFGLREFAVRFPPALFGTLAIFIVFYLTSVLSGNKKVALFAAFFIAISPWHIALSRASSEAVISLTLTLIGLTFLIKSFQDKKIADLLTSVIFLSLSYFFYHTFRLLTPPLVFISCVYYYRPFRIRQIYKPTAIILILLSALTFAFSLDPNARGRFSQVSIFSDLDVHFELQKLPFEEGNNHVLTARIFHNKIVLYSIRFVTEFTRYFSSDFLIGSWGAKPLRYVTVDNGPLMYLELLIIVFGFVSFIKNKFHPLLLCYLLIAPLAAALTTEDTPNLSRALFMSPLLCIFAGLGLEYIIKTIPKYKQLIIFLLALNFIYFWHMYTIHNRGREEIAMNRNDGVTTLIPQISRLQEKYSQVYLTNIPDSLYPWYAFYLRLDPQTFNLLAKNRAYGYWQYKNLVFSEFKCPSSNLSNIMGSVAIVDSEGCPDQPNLTDLGKISRSSGGVAYKIWGRE